MPARLCHGHGQPQGSPRCFGWFDPRVAADGTRCCRCGYRWRLPRQSRDRRPRHPGAYHNRPSAPTNLTLHQALDINVPIGCGDVAVWPGDVVVGDREGVIIVPAHLAEEVADEAVEMTAFEDFVTEEVRKGRSIIGLYPATHEETKADFARWRLANGR
ncbi:hypothetical protein LPU83_pLPU83c_0475 (plasmid) [Rhizobium favelukesii]|uniref:Demethylmenaquinone methyltransferase n=1 Tax=Rhizobium favelukesii TaxID=348824 RepID=W6RIP4_9HYPH|nr:hypothetical protein LPU83_pLPU83c_0475 [Rhizobium favelukesii]